MKITEKIKDMELINKIKDMKLADKAKTTKGKIIIGCSVLVLLLIAITDCGDSSVKKDSVNKTVAVKDSIVKRDKLNNAFAEASKRTASANALAENLKQDSRAERAAERVRQRKAHSDRKAAARIAKAKTLTPRVARKGESPVYVSKSRRPAYVSTSKADSAPAADDSNVKKLVLKICRNSNVNSGWKNLYGKIELRNIRIIDTDEKLKRTTARAEIVDDSIVYNIIYAAQYTTDGKLYVTVKGRNGTKSGFADNKQNVPEKASAKPSIKDLRKELKAKILNEVSRYVYSNEIGVPLALIDKKMNYGYINKQNDGSSRKILKHINEVMEIIPEAKFDKFQGNQCVTFNGIWSFIINPKTLNSNITAVARRSYNLNVLKKLEQGKIIPVQLPKKIGLKISKILSTKNIRKGEFETTKAYKSRIKRLEIEAYKTLKKSGLLDNKVYYQKHYSKEINLIFDPDASTLSFIDTRALENAIKAMDYQASIDKILKFDILGILEYTNSYAYHSPKFKCSVAQAKQVKKELAGRWQAHRLMMYRLFNVNNQKGQAIKLSILSEKQFQDKYDKLIAAANEAFSKQEWRKANEIYTQAMKIPGDRNDVKITRRQYQAQIEELLESISILSKNQHGKDFNKINYTCIKLWDDYKHLFDTLKSGDKDNRKRLLKSREELKHFYLKMFSRNIPVKLIYIAPGTFQMGSNDGERNERPVHKVTFDKGYWISKYQCHKPLYEKIMGKFKYRNSVEVTWNDAMEFCKRLSAQERAAGRLPEGYEYRLPTEAEWEFAAGGANSNHRCDSLKYGDRREIEAAPYHIINTSGERGNFREWSLDDYHSNYDNAPSNGSRWGTGESSQRVVRGKSSTKRSGATISKSYVINGFRIVLAQTSNSKAQANNK